MPRYFFDVEIESHFVCDARGLDLPDPEAAIHEAQERAERLLEARTGDRSLTQKQVLHLRDQQGFCLMRIAPGRMRH